MASRRDQLQSYQFMMQRVISSIIVRETDPEQTPLRRGVGAVFGGVMIAVLVAAIFGVIGVFTGVGGTSWKADGSIIIERETGTRYVYRDDTLRPVINYASARLISGASDAETHRVAGSSLAGIPREVPVGIVGAPDSLPPTDRVAGTPWTMCSIPRQDAAGAPITQTGLVVGGQVPGGVPLGERGLLVRDAADGTHYLLWRDHRYRISGDDPDGVIRSLFGARNTIMEVGTAWLNGIPAGQDIGTIEVGGRGAMSTAAEGRRVGDLLYHAVSDGEQYYLVLDGGLAPLTELQMRLLRGQYAVEAQEIAPSVANSIPTVDALAPVSGDPAPPPAPPQLVLVPGDGRAALCSETSGSTAAPEVSLGGDISAIEDGIETTRESSSGTKLADQVLVPPGQIAVVRAMPSDRAGPGAVNLVTDVGLRFPVPSDEVLTSLGYQPADAVPMPAALVQRIPAGPTLSPEAALIPAPVPGTG
ncbi:type VII secretion protein EccB [Amycolatopsis marina]|uniref:Type VII secretion protein EccB n=1 Tax=Amycolatopsis marina TaxID=490629 RepID=A0A1I1AVY0_9PSEU|nr:type VII secretion protein EccB [Amycolatopsis marina]SFB40588.1 type VII secretion protein EccB [Amycolatopsis marina]